MIPLQLLVASLIGWLQREQQEVIECLGNELIDGVGGQHPSGRVRRRQSVGGLLSYY